MVLDIKKISFIQEFEVSLESNQCLPQDFFFHIQTHVDTSQIKKIKHAKMLKTIINVIFSNLYDPLSTA